jgi:hypothetical protein
MSQGSDRKVAELTPKNVTGLPVRHIAEIEAKPPGAQWLIEQLWTASGVGIIGGQPKCFKTWLAAELALAVASGTKALGRFAPAIRGPVLFFAAEDDPPAMRARFEAVAAARGVRIQDAHVLLIDVAQLRLDDPVHLARLRTTIASIRPRLLILDPFIRVARVDENSAQEVSALLGELRAIQRDHDVAILVVHHMRKASSNHPGQQLRGSGDFAAWLDSGLYLCRDRGGLVLTVEHRGAAAPPPMHVRLELKDTPHLVADEGPTPAPQSLDPVSASILRRLRAVRRPLTTSELRGLLKVRKAKLIEALQALLEQNLIVKTNERWTLPDGSGTP